MTQEPETPQHADDPGDNVRDVRRPPVAGPHYRNLLIAAGLLVAVIGASLWITPRGAREKSEPAAPAPPERTFLDLPPAPEERERRPAPRAPWWSAFASRADETEAPPEEMRPAFPAWEEPPPEAAPPPPPDPRRQSFERALRSSTTKTPERSLAHAAAAASATFPSLAAAASSLPRPEALADLTAPRPPRAEASAGLDLAGYAPGSSASPAGLSSPGPSSPPARSSLGRRHAEPLLARRYPPPGPTTLRAGTFIPARLETAIDSDAPGPVTARVLRDVTDSATGRRVLIPAGAQLLGSVESQLAYGGNRVLVAFERLTFPGRTYELPGLDGLETRGSLGLSDRVDHHLLATLGRAVLLAALGAGYEISQPRRTSAEALSSGDIVAAQMALELNRVAGQLLARGLERRPTVRVRPGERFYVYVHRDLIL